MLYYSNMSNKQIIAILKNYQKKSSTDKKSYLRMFEKKMLYRTTKTENPETTMSMVEKVLRKLSPKT